jgi:tRNA-binding EMAP/Myf-like protein
MMENISFDDWKKMDIVVGKVLEVKRVAKTEKLYKLRVDVGRDKQIQIVTSLVPYYRDDELQNRRISCEPETNKILWGSFRRHATLRREG